MLSPKGKAAAGKKAISWMRPKKTRSVAETLEYVEKLLRLKIILQDTRVDLQHIKDKYRYRTA